MQTPHQVVSNPSTVVELILSTVDWFCIVIGPDTFHLLLRILEETLLLTDWAAEAACHISSSDTKTSARGAETWQGNRLCSTPRAIVFLIRTSCVCVTENPKP